jgi:hypothetical protein
MAPVRVLQPPRWSRMDNSNSNQGKVFSSFTFLSTIYSYMKMTEIICKNCGKKCKKPTKEINRQIKRGKIEFYCSRSCSTSKLKTTTEKIKSNCLFCGQEFETTTHKNHRKCCNKICAVKYAQLKVNPNNHKLSTQRKINFPKEKKFVCVICGCDFLRNVKSNVDL